MHRRTCVFARGQAAGSKIVSYVTFDNSAGNKFNPAPDQELPWGAQSWHEMNAGEKMRERHEEKNHLGDGFAAQRSLRGERVEQRNRCEECSPVQEVQPALAH